MATEPVDLKLEVVTLSVSDVDRSKAFYEGLGWRLDADFAIGDSFRGIQFTPPGSECSIQFGKGVTNAAPGLTQRLILAVSNIEAARADLIARGVEVSEVFHRDGDNPQAPGPDPERRTYSSLAAFQDPDGNGWVLQEVTVRPPGREWKLTRGGTRDTASLADLLHETEQHHGAYESSHAAHNWWDWYAPYLSARQNGSTVEDATAAANRYMDEVIQVPPR